MREIRCLLPIASADSMPRPANSWAGTSAASGAGPFYVLAAVVDGPADASTGYVCDIKVIDEILRNEVAAGVASAVRGAASLAEIIAQMPHCLSRAARRAPSPAMIRELQVRISPFTRLAIRREEDPMVRLTQSFEFSASHRLFRPEFSDQENLRVFGKCSNPAGHGHNYVVEVTVSGAGGSPSESAPNIGELDRVVKARVIDGFDHKNLNLECPEFATLNPTVENIARVIWDRLADHLPRCKLLNVRVWETPKTYAEYEGAP